MYTLLGFIQMLMLTQTRLMPDLDVLFKQPPPKTEAVAPLAGTQQLVKTTFVYRADITAIRRKRNTEKWVPPVCRNAVRRPSIKASFSRTRVLTADKLYLVFCQWKTEG